MTIERKVKSKTDQSQDQKHTGRLKNFLNVKWLSKETMIYRYNNNYRSIAVWIRNMGNYQRLRKETNCVRKSLGNFLAQTMKDGRSGKIEFGIFINTQVQCPTQKVVDKHGQDMSEGEMGNTIVKNECQDGRTPLCRPKIRWKDQVMKDITRLVPTLEVTKDRREWKAHCL